MVRRAILAAALIVASLSVASAEEGPALLHSGTDITNPTSLQRGARNFMNYCAGCHSLQYLRYNRMATDLGIDDKGLAEDLIFDGSKPFEHIKSSMPADAEQWFGKQPPDLSLIARAKGGPDYVYTFLKSFYLENGRLWGVNNSLLSNVAMPHVLQALQGEQEPIFENESDGRGNTKLVLKGLQLKAAGALQPAEYDEFVRDIANFLDYAGEPVKAKRQVLGVWVMAFLLVFFAFAYLLKKEYWKDVH